MESSTNANWERLFILAVALFFILAPHPGVVVSNNAAAYLSEAGQLYQGIAPAIHKNGLVARGPVFSYFIAGSFLFSGLSVGAAALLMKVFFVLLMVCLYLIARTFYNSRAALIAVVLAVVSFRIYLIGTAIDSNSALTLFLLLFVASILKIWRAGNRNAYLTAGFYLSIAFLIKETSLVYAPLLLISLVYPKSSLKEVFKRSIYTFSSVAACLLPWVAYVYYKTSSILPVLGHFNPEFQKYFSSKIGNDISQSFFQNFPNYLFRFFSEMLPEATWLYLPILMLLAWHSVHLIRKRAQNKHLNEDLLLTAAILLYLPIPMSDMAASTGDARQGYIIYFLFFIISGKWISIIWDRLNFKFPTVSTKVLVRCGILFASIGAIMIAVISYYPFQRPVLLKIQKTIRNYSIIPEIKDRYTDLHKESATWLVENLTQGESIITDGYFDEPFRFFTTNRYKTVLSFPSITSHEYISTAKPVFLITYKKFRQSSGAERFFWVISEEKILQDLKPGKLVVFSHQSGFLAEYFDKAPWAALIHKNSDTFIYRINEIPASIVNGLKPFINEEFEDDMEWAKTNDPEVFSKLTKFLKAYEIEYSELIKSATVLKAGKYL